jgi:hypothetical protein
MQVDFRQCYIEDGANFPFSHHFQGRVSEEIGQLVASSAKFTEKYGSDFDLIFNVSAKKVIKDNEIRGPSVFRKTKQVEYSIFLPFDVIIRGSDAPKLALRFLLQGVCEVLALLGIDEGRLLENQESLVEGILADPNVLAERSWDEAQNRTRVRLAFEKFFEKTTEA